MAERDACKLLGKECLCTRVLAIGVLDLCCVKSLVEYW